MISFSKDKCKIEIKGKNYYSIPIKIVSFLMDVKTIKAIANFYIC